MQVKPDAPHVTLNPMLRRAQLALALILLLVLAPLAGATCGIQCLAAAPHPSTHAATAQHQCVRASACCHPGGPILCSAANSPENTAALLSADTPHDPPAFAVVIVESPSQTSRTLVGRNIDSSPPGQLRAANPLPLRV